MLGEFTDWARDQRDDLTELLADIELERFGPSETDTIADIHKVITNLVKDSIRMVEVAILHDETIEEELSDHESAGTFVTRIEIVARELEWSDPDGRTLRDLGDAVRGFYDNEIEVFV